MSRTKLFSVVSRQIPEFVREDHSKFVAFIEAYYEFLQSQGVTYNEIKDVDLTLDKFIGEIKKELAYNIPYIVEDERFFLSKIKDQYLAKGSEASFKLLFKLLFNKEVELTYPGKQMLRASDGRWNQETSIFAKVIFGNPEDVVGKIVEIQSFNKILRVQVDKKQEITGEVERIVNVGNNVYEFFIDRKFYGRIFPGNTLKLGNTFQATILPITSVVKVSKPGAGFRVGQVFEIRNTTGTGTLIKVIRVDENGGLKHIQVIKFGVGYLANFTTSLLPTSAISAISTTASTSSTYNVSVTDLGGGNEQYFSNIIDPKVVLDEHGFISTADYVVAEWVDPSWAGTILREFSTQAKDAATSTQSPAIIEISLDAIARYPGYYETNDGFLSDSIFIQDSRYYQAFSYVTKISERLDKYKSAVKTMLHPAGMELFGEYEITDYFDLTLEIESLVKSLALSFEELPIEFSDYSYWHFFKNVTYNSPDTVTMTEPITNNHNNIQIPVSRITSVIGKSLTEPVSIADDPAKNIFKTFTETVEILDALLAAQGVIVNPDAASLTEVVSRDIGKSFTDLQLVYDGYIMLDAGNAKYPMITDIPIFQNEEGYVVLNGYEEGGYFSEVYANARDATFSS